MPRVVTLAGATGLVGREILRGLLADSSVSAIHVLARPSFLAGNREVLGQPVRRGEGIALFLSRVLGPFFPKNYRSIPATAVAKTLLTRVPLARGREVLLSGEMQP